MEKFAYGVATCMAIAIVCSITLGWAGGLSTRVDNFTDQDITAMRQTYIPNVAQCAVDQIQIITRDLQAGDQWVIDLGSPQDITFQRIDMKRTITCGADGVRDLNSEVNPESPSDTFTPYTPI